MIVLGSNDINLITSTDSILASCEVLLSTYNGSKYISKQIDSILAQRGVMVHITIRDDGSTDNTIPIIEYYQSRNPNMIRIIKGSNVGIHMSYKLLMEETDRSCSYYCFSDQDDIWDIDKLYIAIASLKNKKAEYYCSASRLVDEYGKDLCLTTTDIKKNYFYSQKNNIIFTPGSQGCTIVLSRKMFCSLLDHGIPAGYGHDTWIPIVANYFYKSIYDPFPRMNYRQHNNSWTGNRKNKVSQFKTEIMQYFSGLNRYSLLAGSLISLYNKELSKEDYSVLASVANKNLSFRKRLYALRKYKFAKYGLRANIVFKLYYLFH